MAKNMKDSEKDELLQEAKSIMQHAGMKSGETEKAMHLLEQIPGWKDADTMLETCRKQIEQTTRIQENERQIIHEEMRIERLKKKRRKIVMFVFLGTIAAAAVVIVILKATGVF